MEVPRHTDCRSIDEVHERIVGEESPGWTGRTNFDVGRGMRRRDLEEGDQMRKQKV